MLTALYLTLFIAGLFPLVIAAYLLCLTLFAWIKSFAQPDTTKETFRFLFLIPAHNEEKLLPKTISNLRSDLDYDQNLVEILVIADNCTDQTAQVSTLAGANVLERFDTENLGKGHALSWGLSQVWAADKTPDAIIILDADSVISSNFLKAASANLAQGHQVIQSFYSVLNPTESWSAGLRYAALSVLHYVRPLGRSLYGGSAGLKGNGMIFASKILQNHSWSESLTEDIEFHMNLLLQGQPVHFAPHAVVWAEMPNTLEASASQNQRWETGRLEMAKKYVPQLIRATIAPKPGQTRNAIPQLDAVMEHLIPPFAIYNGISVGLIILNGLFLLFDPTNLLARFNFGAALVIFIVQLIYLLSGLRLTKADPSVYKNLLYAPVYIGWKILLAMRIVTNKSEENWIRTARNETT